LSWINGFVVSNAYIRDSSIPMGALVGFAVISLPTTAAQLAVARFTLGHTTIRQLWKPENWIFLVSSQLIVTVIMPRSFYVFESWLELLTLNFTFSRFQGHLFRVYEADGQNGSDNFKIFERLGMFVINVFAHCVILSQSLLVTFLVPASLLQLRIAKRTLRITAMDEAYAAVVCITTIVSSFLYYSRLYHGGGTFNPTWTGVFG
jgi:hypothetical protein